MTAQMTISSTHPDWVDVLPARWDICFILSRTCRMAPSRTPPARPPTTPAPARLITLDGAMYESDIAGVVPFMKNTTNPGRLVELRVTVDAAHHTRDPPSVACPTSRLGNSSARNYGSVVHCRP